VIKIEGLRKDIGKNVILRDINLEIGTGLTFIIGDSGAGKSTLLNIIGGLDAPTDGEVSFEIGQEIEHITGCSRYQRDYLGFVFQDSNLINGLTIKENVMLATQISGVKRSEKELESTLAYFGLQECADRKVDGLSGGERQRAAMARAVIKDVSVLLADEPTGSLDRTNSIQVFDMLKTLSSERIVIVVSHNEEMAYKYGDRIIRISDGEVVDDVNNYLGTIGERTGSKKEKRKGKGLDFNIVKALTFNNIRRYKAKFISIILAMAVAFATVGIVCSMNMDMSVEMKEMNTVYYDADMITFYPYPLGIKTVESIIMGGDYSSIPDELYLDVMSSPLFEGVVPVYDIDYFVKNTEDHINVKLISLTDFFYERLMTDAVIGSFPQSQYQIILAKDMAEKYYDGEAIGKTITITSDFGISKTYDIVGVNQEKNVDGIYFTYIVGESISASTYENLFASIYLASNVEDLSKIMYSEDASGFVVAETDGDIIYGTSPLSNQIVVSTDMVRNIYYSMTGEYVDFTFENVKNADPCIKDKLDEVLAQEYYISANRAYKCRIVGIHSGASYEVVLDDDWTQEVSAVLPSKIECYCKNMQIVQSFNDSELAAQYAYVSNYEERFENAVSTTGIWKMMFAIALIIITLLLVVLMHSYSKIAVSGRLYEMGILSSLGLEKKEIRKILSFEIYLVGAASCMAGGVLYIIFCALSVMFSDVCIGTASAGKILLALSIFCCIVCILVTRLEVRKVANTSTIVAIKSRE
ncbi:MAG: ABC transporter ATP-binding protein/permease, partial [Lachnospiraceae bacterium]|nr:ABC transporter ATP-binding protein/permease [Lachnospiraceae bacterium]